MNPFRKLKGYLLSLPDREYVSWKTQAVIDEIRDYSKTPDLCRNILSETASGVTSSRCCNEEVIVSLSTFGDRIHGTALTIESLFEQTVKPNRVILNLGRQFEGKGKIPGSLKLLERRGLEITFTRDIGPFTKLLPTLAAHPNSTIITVDDDIIYGYDFISNLVNEHIQHPSEIIAPRCRMIETGRHKHISGFLDWKLAPDGSEANMRFLPEGVNGILYPPGSLDERVFDEKTFLSLCPSTDDFWFKAMSMLKGTLVRKTYSEGDYMTNLRTAGHTLHEVNKSGGYDRQLQALFNHFELWSLIDQHYKAWLKFED